MKHHQGNKVRTYTAFLSGEIGTSGDHAKTICVHTSEYMKRIEIWTICACECMKWNEMDNMCRSQWFRDGGTALSSPCGLHCTVQLYIQYMEAGTFSVTSVVDSEVERNQVSMPLYIMGVYMC